MKELSEAEAEALVLKVLREAGGPLLTKDVEAKVRADGAQCPDSAARFLNKLRFKGKIKGELDIEKRGWKWWLEE